MFCCVLALCDRCQDFSSKRKRCDGKTPPNAWRLCHGGTTEDLGECLHPSMKDAGGARVHGFNSQSCTNVISRAQWGSDNSVPSMLRFQRWLVWQIRRAGCCDACLILVTKVQQELESLKSEVGWECHNMRRRACWGPQQFCCNSFHSHHSHLQISGSSGISFTYHQANLRALGSLNPTGTTWGGKRLSCAIFCSWCQGLGTRWQDVATLGW